MFIIILCASFLMVSAAAFLHLSHYDGRECTNYVGITSSTYLYEDWMVENTRVELVTSCLQGRRSTNWANSPYNYIQFHDSPLVFYSRNSCTKGTVVFIQIWTWSFKFGYRCETPTHAVAEPIGLPIAVSLGFMVHSDGLEPPTHCL